MSHTEREAVCDHFLTRFLIIATHIESSRLILGKKSFSIYHTEDVTLFILLDRTILLKSLFLF